MVVAELIEITTEGQLGLGIMTFDALPRAGDRVCVDTDEPGYHHRYLEVVGVYHMPRKLPHTDDLHPHTRVMAKTLARKDVKIFGW